MGRRATHHFAGGYHTLAVSPKGRRFKNFARDEGSATAGAAPGLALFGVGAAKGVRTADKINSKGGLGTAGKGAMRALHTAHGVQAAGLLAAAGGSVAARQANLTSMNRKGYLKKEEVKKNVKTGLEMVAAGRKGLPRTAMTGANRTKRDWDLPRRIAQGKKIKTDNTTAETS
jgi:hypothetical protein